jgi:hypothetical protein
MPQNKGIKVTGIPEAEKAFNQVKHNVEDLSKVHKAAAEMLLPDVQTATRHKTGALAAGWRADAIATEAQFINDVVYAGVQEFGWSDRNIEPTYAITQSFEANEKRTEALYADGIGDIARDAGFDTKG